MIDDVIRYNEDRIGSYEITDSNVIRRIELAIPSGTGRVQKGIIYKAVATAKKRGVELMVTVVR